MPRNKLQRFRGRIVRLQEQRDFLAKRVAEHPEFGRDVRYLSTLDWAIPILTEWTDHYEDEAKS